jgi:hypothetical protein
MSSLVCSFGRKCRGRTSDRHVNSSVDFRKRKEKHIVAATSILYWAQSRPVHAYACIGFETTHSSWIGTMRIFANAEGGEETCPKPLRSFGRSSVGAEPQTDDMERDR